MDIETHRNETNPQFSDPIHIIHGPLSFIYQNGMLRSIMHGKTEIIRRIYLALRDQHWNTIPYRITKTDIQQNENNFSLCFEANHLHKSIKFQWNGLIECDRNGTIRFQIRGKALSTFDRNRIGLCLLFPLSFSGKPVSISDSEGTVVNGRFPVDISPHQPFLDITAIQGAAADVRYTVNFDGDIFEMEDQRNWIDASYKVYSTPINLPLPVTIHDSDEIYQSIMLTMVSSATNVSEITREAMLKIPVNTDPDLRCPQLGTTDTLSESISPDAIEYLKALQLNHCRYDLYLDSKTLLSDITMIARRCVMYGCAAEIALHCTTVTSEKIGYLLTAFTISSIDICRLCIYDDAKVTSDVTLNALVPAIKNRYPKAIIASGTDFYFVELNRSHPSLYMVDQVCYSANPQVHTFDNDIVIENLDGIRETLLHAPSFAGNLPIIITPLTLRPRKNGKNPLKDGGADIRQKDLFCAAWTAGALFRSIEGKASSVTLHAATADGGLMPSDGARVYPVYDVLQWFAGTEGYPVSICQSYSSNIEAMIIHTATERRMLIVNLSDHKETVIIEGLPGEFSSKTLDQLSLEAAVSNPIAWNSLRPQYHLCTDNRFKTELYPYAIKMLIL
jgi:hypothetical protein